MHKPKRISAVGCLSISYGLIFWVLIWLRLAFWRDIGCRLVR